MKLKLILFLFVTIAFLSACDFEAPRAYKISLSPKQLLHSVNSSASGSASLSLVKEQRGDYTANILTVSGTYKNVSGPVTTVNLYGPASSDKEGPVMMKLEFTEGAVVGSGTFSGKKDLNDNQIHMYIGKMTYINLASSKYKNGELRGQVSD